MIDINKITLWNIFKEKLILALDDLPPFEVDLDFDSYVGAGHYHFSANQEIIIHDILLDLNGKLTFSVMNHSGTCFFSLEEADIITSKGVTLFEVIHKSYQTARENLEEDFENGSLMSIHYFLDEVQDIANSIEKRKTIEILNNSSEHIRFHIEKTKHREAIKKIENYGIF